MIKLYKKYLFSLLVCLFLLYQMPSSTPSIASSISQCHLIITDFDETITAEDSLHLVLETAFNIKPNFEHNYSHYISTYLQAREDFRLRNDELINSRYNSSQHEIAFQKLMKDVELSSVKELVKTGLFEGVPKKLFQKASGLIKTKAGFWNFLQKFHNKVPIVILSVNWSYLMLENYFKAKGYIIDDKNLFLVTNEFEFDSNDVCTGQVAHSHLSDGVRTGYDKLILTRKFMQKFDTQGTTFYIGDSETDVLSMIECGKSISMTRKNHDSATMLQKFGKQLNTVADNEIHYVVDDWNEIV